MAEIIWGSQLISVVSKYWSSSPPKNRKILQNITVGWRHLGSRATALRVWTRVWTRRHHDKERGGRRGSGCRLSAMQQGPKQEVLHVEAIKRHQWLKKPIFGRRFEMISPRIPNDPHWRAIFLGVFQVKPPSSHFCRLYLWGWQMFREATPSFDAGYSHRRHCFMVKHSTELKKEMNDEAQERLGWHSNPRILGFSGCHVFCATWAGDVLDVATCLPWEISHCKKMGTAWDLELSPGDKISSHTASPWSAPKVFGMELQIPFHGQEIWTNAQRWVENGWDIWAFWAAVTIGWARGSTVHSLVYADFHRRWWEVLWLLCHRLGTAASSV